MWTYVKYSRPPKIQRGESAPSHAAHHPPHANAGGKTEESHDTEGGETGRDTGNSAVEDKEQGQSGLRDRNDARDDQQEDNNKEDHGMRSHEGHNMEGHKGHNMGCDRSMFAITTIGVCHCGAGCVLGDIIGEWIVYGSDATINGRALWSEFLVGKFDISNVYDKVVK